MSDTSTLRDPDAHALALVCARTADAEQGADVVVLDVGDILGVTEYFVICHAGNRRLVRALVDRIEQRAREQRGRSPLRAEGSGEQQWVLLDFGDVVVHVFLDEVRRFYEIERLYTDAVRVDWADGDTATAAQN
jgi:ribosome-associated protein